MNTIVPQAWIIQEKLRIERERRRKENEDNSLPISLPEREDDLIDLEQSPPESPSKSTVIIIDI